MTSRCETPMDNLTTEMNWYCPAYGIYTLYPVNSPAVLMQWRLLVTLIAKLSVTRHAKFRRIGTDYVWPRPRHGVHSSRLTWNQLQRGQVDVNPKTIRSRRPMNHVELILFTIFVFFP